MYCDYNDPRQTQKNTAELQHVYATKQRQNNPQRQFWATRRHLIVSAANVLATKQCSLVTSCCILLPAPVAYCSLLLLFLAVCSRCFLLYAPATPFSLLLLPLALCSCYLSLFAPVTSCSLLLLPLALCSCYPLLFAPATSCSLLLLHPSLCSCYLLLFAPVTSSYLFPLLLAIFRHTRFHILFLFFLI